MKAMILAAGLGKRMRPLTEHTPKPLLEVGGKALLDYHLEKLAAAGIKEVVINNAWLGEQITQHVGDGSRFGLSVQHSSEGECMNSAGGIINALPLLGDEPFALVNGDVWSDYDYASLCNQRPAGMHLVLADNPKHHPEGDFALIGGALSDEGEQRLTYTGIAVINPALFAGHKMECQPLKPFMLDAIAQGTATGEHYRGQWWDVGTPERLAELDTLLGNGVEA